MMTPLILAAAAAVASSPVESPAVTVENAWVRLPAVASRPAAGYFTIVGGSQAQSIVKIESPAARRAELHQSRMEGGVMKMVPLGEVAVPPNTRVTFKPMSNHAMLYGLDGGLKAGGHVPLVFTLGSGAKVTVKAQVVNANEGPGTEHQHHH